MKIEAVIFDFNGVLWWDGNLQDKAWKQFSKQLRGWPLTDDEMDVHVHGRNNRYTLHYLTGKPVAGKQLAQLSEEKETIYRELCLAQGADFKLSPGAIPFLDYLVEGQIPRTIATASGKSNVDFFVQHLDLQRWFAVDRIVYDDGKKAGKPAPDFYLAAAKTVEKRPGRCLVIEDSLSGIASARAAGIGLVMALGPRQRHPLLRRQQGVGRAIESLEEVPRSLFGETLPADR